MRMMRVAILGGLITLILGLTHGSAHADPVKLDYSFTASDFNTFPVPVDPVTGAFSLTFDNNVGSVDQTSVTLTNLNISLGSPAVFSYELDGYEPDTLFLGGLQYGATGLASGTDDFALVIHNASTTPSFARFYYTQAGFSSDSFYTSTGTLTATTPEPSTLSLLAFGVAGFGVRRWRQRKSRWSSGRQDRSATF